MNKHVFTYVVSKNICWSDMVVELLSAIHKQYSFKIEQSVDSLWELPSNSIVIYDKDSIGNPASLLITPAERGGEWLIVNGKPEDEECVAGFISLGFSGLIVSPYTLEILPRALRNISNGQLWFSREAMSGALRHLVRGGGLSSPQSMLLEQNIRFLPGSNRFSSNFSKEEVIKTLQNNFI